MQEDRRQVPKERKQLKPTKETPQALEKGNEISLWQVLKIMNHNIRIIEVYMNQILGSSEHSPEF